MTSKKAKADESKKKLFGSNTRRVSSDNRLIAKSVQVGIAQVGTLKTKLVILALLRSLRPMKIAELSPALLLFPASEKLPRRVLPLNACSCAVKAPKKYSCICAPAPIIPCLKARVKGPFPLVVVEMRKSPLAKFPKKLVP